MSRGQIVEEEASMSKAMHCCEKGERTATKIEKRAELNRGGTSKLSEGIQYMVAKRGSVKQRRSKNERSYTEGRLWGEVRMVKARKSVP